MTLEQRPEVGESENRADVGRRLPLEGRASASLEADRAQGSRPGRESRGLWRKSVAWDEQGVDGSRGRRTQGPWGTVRSEVGAQAWSWAGTALP